MNNARVWDVDNQDRPGEPNAEVSDFGWSEGFRAQLAAKQCVDAIWAKIHASEPASAFDLAVEMPSGRVYTVRVSVDYTPQFNTSSAKMREGGT